jgi:hypothetical protein
VAEIEKCGAAMNKGLGLSFLSGTVHFRFGENNSQRKKKKKKGKKGRKKKRRAAAFLFFLSICRKSRKGRVVLVATVMCRCRTRLYISPKYRNVLHSRIRT